MFLQPAEQNCCNCWWLSKCNKDETDLQIVLFFLIPRHDVLIEKRVFVDNSDCAVAESWISKLFTPAATLRLTPAWGRPNWTECSECIYTAAPLKFCLFSWTEASSTFWKRKENKMPSKVLLLHLSDNTRMTPESYVHTPHRLHTTCTPHCGGRS